MGPDAPAAAAGHHGDDARVADPYDLATAIEAYPTQQAGSPTRRPAAASLRAARASSSASRAPRTGYCLHYATTMAILLRAAQPENPIPTRLVEGFLPGDRVGNVETVGNRAAHAWVEVYFPGYGWIPFDPDWPPAAPSNLAPVTAPVDRVRGTGSGRGGSGAAPRSRPRREAPPARERDRVRDPRVAAVRVVLDEHEPAARRAARRGSRRARAPRASTKWRLLAASTPSNGPAGRPA